MKSDKILKKPYRIMIKPDKIFDTPDKYAVGLSFGCTSSECLLVFLISHHTNPTRFATTQIHPLSAAAG
jgi:hypothetical protein